MSRSIVEPQTCLLVPLFEKYYFLTKRYSCQVVIFRVLKCTFTIAGGKKVLVGIYKSDVENGFIKWYNGGIIWQGEKSLNF